MGPGVGGDRKSCDFLCSLGSTEAVPNRKLSVMLWLQKPQGLSVVKRFSSAIPEPHKIAPSVLTPCQEADPSMIVLLQGVWPSQKRKSPESFSSV